MPPDGSTGDDRLVGGDGEDAGRRVEVRRRRLRDVPCGYACQYPGLPVIAVRLTATALAPAAPGTVKFRDSPGWKVRRCGCRAPASERASGWNRPAVAVSAARVVPEEVDDDVAAGAAVHVDHAVGTDRDGHEVRDRVPPASDCSSSTLRFDASGRGAGVRPHGPVAGAGGAGDREVEYGGDHRSRRRQRRVAGDADRQRSAGRQGRREAGVDEPLRGRHRHVGAA